MPYNSLKDINPSLKGIKPPITLEQANSIASTADGMEAKDIKGAWGIAIKQFKQFHTVRNKKWVERNKMPEKTKENNPVVENHFLSQEVLDDVQTKEFENECYVPFSVKSFSQLKLQQESEEISKGVKETTSYFTQILWNIMNDSMIEPENKITDAQNLIDEFMAELAMVLTPSMENTSEKETEKSKDDGKDSVKLIESFSGEITLQESNDPGNVTYLDLQIIRPGWGNTHDNNFYPKETLAKDANKFVGVKMYETDHREDEKSTRTWVSTVKEIKGFTDDGAPIARVAVHDPGFAQRIRNLQAAGILDKMECSILGSGKVRRNFEADGRKGNMVEALTSVSSVDWVTRAGAGGKVLNLEESASEIVEPENQNNKDKENGNMKDEINLEAKDVETPDETKTTEAQLKEKLPGEERKPIEKKVIEEALSASRLPVISQQRLAEKSYFDLSELTTAITGELDYIKSVSGSGKPFSLSESENPTPKQPDLTEINRRKDEVNQKYLR
ncbi:MAG: hypothetical protein WC373_06695 [Smithella sp.]|jgi:hypothetical protein